MVKKRDVKALEKVKSREENNREKWSSEEENIVETVQAISLKEQKLDNAGEEKVLPKD
jgi:hypothetical protein